MIVPYRDAPWTSTLEGQILPTYKELDLREFYEGELGEWANIKLTQDRCAFVLPSGKRVMFSTVYRVLRHTGRYEHAIKLLSPYITLPNGQVKNFLNACVAMAPVEGKCRVALVGSKSGEASGLWHRMFVAWLLRKNAEIEVDFYDPTERDADWEVCYGSARVRARWIQRVVDAAELESEGYDVLIDDVWTVDGPSLPYSREWLATLKNYSIKQFRPPLFLHQTEGREFKVPPEENQYDSCLCLTCKQIRRAAGDYSAYSCLRQMCGRLGHVVPCKGIDFLEELGIIALMKRALVQGVSASTTGTELARFMTALSEEIGIRQEQDTYFSAGSPDFQAFSRFQVVGERRFKVPWLEGKKVAFLGVPSSIVGSTSLQFSSTSFDSPVDAAFVNSLDTWKLHLGVTNVYCRAKPEEVMRVFFDWELTGNVVRGYREWVHKTPIVDPCLDVTVKNVETSEGPTMEKRKGYSLASRWYPESWTRERILADEYSQCGSFQQQLRVLATSGAAVTQKILQLHNGKMHMWQWIPQQCEVLLVKGYFSFTSERRLFSVVSSVPNMVGKIRQKGDPPKKEQPFKPIKRGEDLRGKPPDKNSSQPDQGWTVVKRKKK